MANENTQNRQTLLQGKAAFFFKRYITKEVQYHQMNRNTFRSNSSTKVIRSIPLPPRNKHTIQADQWIQDI